MLETKYSAMGSVSQLNYGYLQLYIQSATETIALHGSLQQLLMYAGYGCMQVITRPFPSHERDTASESKEDNALSAVYSSKNNR